jgi:hypothetical protein
MTGLIRVPVDVVVAELPSLPETATQIYRRSKSKRFDVVVFDFGRAASHGRDRAAIR